jgi:hypothetical protein
MPPSNQSLQCPFQSNLIQDLIGALLVQAHWVMVSSNQILQRPLQPDSSTSPPTRIFQDLIGTFHLRCSLQLELAKLP